MFDGLKLRQQELAKSKRRSELLPEASERLLSGEEKDWDERNRLDQSGFQLNQTIDVGSSTLERLRSQGRVMKVRDLIMQIGSAQESHGCGSKSGLWKESNSNSAQKK